MATTQEDMRPKKDKPKTFVIGMGPAGLSAALALVLRNHDVTLLDKRGNYNRKQRIFLPETLIKDFFKLSGLAQKGVSLKFTSDYELQLVGVTEAIEKAHAKDIHFFRRIEELNCVIPLMELQKYQEETLLDLDKRKSFHLPKHDILEDKKALAESEKLTITGSIRIMKGDQYTVTTIDGQSQTLTLKGESASTTLLFDHFIAADGNQHEMVNLIAQSDEKQFKINYKLLPAPRQKEHFALMLKHNAAIDLKGLKTVITPHLENASRIQLSDLPKLQAAGWDKPHLPLIYIHYNQKSREFYITGEIPGTVLTQDPAERNASLIQWGKCLLALEYGTKAEDLLALQSDPESKVEAESAALELASTFNLQPDHAATNYVTLGKGGLFVVIGDAYLKANFLFGHGVSDAISDGNTLYDCFNETGKLMSCQPLEEQAKDRVKAYEALMQSSDLLDQQKAHEQTLAAASSKLSQASEALAALELQLSILADQQNKDKETVSSLMLITQMEREDRKAKDEQARLNQEQMDADYALALSLQ